MSFARPHRAARYCNDSQHSSKFIAKLESLREGRD